MCVFLLVCNTGIGDSLRKSVSEPGGYFFIKKNNKLLEILYLHVKHTKELFAKTTKIFKNVKTNLNRFSSKDKNQKYSTFILWSSLTCNLCHKQTNNSNLTSKNYKLFFVMFSVEFLLTQHSA